MSKTGEAGPLTKPDLLALPEARFERETRSLTDEENQPGIVFPVTLRKPDPLDRSRVAALSRAYIEEWVTGERGKNGKPKAAPNLIPTLDKRRLKVDEDLAAEIGIMEGLQPEDAAVRYTGLEILLLIHRAPGVFEEWRQWALTLWSRPQQGNSDGAAPTA